MLVIVEVGEQRKELMDVDDYCAYVLNEGDGKVLMSWSARPASRRAEHGCVLRHR